MSPIDTHLEDTGVSNMRMVDRREKRGVADSRSRSVSPSVLVLDPSCFSLPYDYSLCEALASRGCAVTLVRSEFVHTSSWQAATSFKVWSHFYQRSHARPRRRAFGLLWKLGKLAEHTRDMARLVTECEKRKPDILHFQWLPVPMIDRGYLRNLRRIAPVVLTLHNTTTFHGSLGQRLHQRIGFDSIFQHLSALIVHTEFSKRQVIERGWLPAEKVHIVSHGVLDYYRSVASVPRVPLAGSEVEPAGPTLLFFGAIESYKGVDLLIRAFAGLPPSMQATSRLCIAGKPGMDMSGLRELARSLKVENRTTWILRFVAEEEIPGLFGSAAAVVLPYREIDQSGVLMTAIAFDKPIVASRVGGLAETIKDGVHGRLFPAGDVPALTAALEEILGHPERRRDMEKSVRELRESISWENSADRTIDLYEQLLSGS
jgi:glycosyltransferase involved in cell wall biosynthesis